ncbi:MAG: hypothetical protein HOM14_19305 [Gammaproteobacteria bacterium]|jgi:hypothetical protein|nr:hypothetical protein [Gammaproteobacteria bacterium]MBT3722560.1 hypothetical protein [Gammaproteobacteria bacterium]MBT4196987.1 hypothetical protein [Gammaproteobacteria bacterium]MBT4451843.1 hypothetical protein [Gammaproteobacteria bacterium]MBT4860755.1 hypothetical protein [Gammaproteobacteria bacterium]
MSKAQQLFNQSFPNDAVKSIKSQAYLSGVLETLQFKETGAKLKNIYELGTAESDAWNAGNREGHRLWRDYGSQEVQS